MHDVSNFLKYLCKYYKCDLVVIDQWHLAKEWISYCRPQYAKKLAKREKENMEHWPHHPLKVQKRQYFSFPNHSRYFAAFCKDSKILMHGTNTFSPKLAKESLMHNYINKVGNGNLWFNIYKRSIKACNRMMKEDHLDGTCKEQLKLFDILKNS